MSGSHDLKSSLKSLSTGTLHSSVNLHSYIYAKHTCVTHIMMAHVGRGGRLDQCIHRKIILLFCIH